MEFCPYILHCRNWLISKFQISLSNPPPLKLIKFGPLKNFIKIKKYKKKTKHLYIFKINYYKTQKTLANLVGCGSEIKRGEEC